MQWIVSFSGRGAVTAPPEGWARLEKTISAMFSTYAEGALAGWPESQVAECVGAACLPVPIMISRVFASMFWNAREG